jgi:hypothetical protein
VVSSSAGDFWHGNTVDWNRAYLTLTVAFNLLVTILILVRLRMASKAVRETTGHDRSIVYGTIFAMIIESAAIYATFTITFLVIYSVGSPVSVGFGNAAGKVTVCHSLRILTISLIFRSYALVFSTTFDHSACREQDCMESEYHDGRLSVPCYAVCVRGYLDLNCYYPSNSSQPKEHVESARCDRQTGMER